MAGPEAFDCGVEVVEGSLSIRLGGHFDDASGPGELSLIRCEFDPGGGPERVDGRAHSFDEHEGGGYPGCDAAEL